MMSERQDAGSAQFEGVASTLLQNPDDPAEMAATLSDLLPKALGAAIGNARAGLSSELVSWVLSGLSGQTGGFTQVCEVKATISAKSGPP